MRTHQRDKVLRAVQSLQEALAVFGVEASLFLDAIPEERFFELGQAYPELDKLLHDAARLRQRAELSYRQLED